jgi:hypothetical protein
MEEKLLSPEVQLFIYQHENDDERALVLKQKEIHQVPSSIIADQIIGRRKAKEKLPTYYDAKNIIYPPSLNIEQSSSEDTAKYKSELLENYLHNKNQKKLSLVDLTGGLGIDSFFFSKSFEQVDYVEPNEDLLKITRHNHQQLEATNLIYHRETAEQFLEKLNDARTVVYIDPSRRSVDNKKIYKLSECTPDIVSLQSHIFNHTKYLLVKASPLLDLQQGLKELKFVKTVFVISVYNECKEVLFLCEKDFGGEAKVEAVNLLSEGRELLSFTFEEEKNSVVNFSSMKKYLYEPNASILKAGAFKFISAHYNVFKLHVNTHLYTSDELIFDFPGRVFEVEKKIKSDAAEAAKYFKEGKANVITRNYPLAVEALKKKLKLKDGGDQYLVGLTTQDEKALVVARRIK